MEEVQREEEREGGTERKEKERERGREGEGKRERKGREGRIESIPSSKSIK